MQQLGLLRYPCLLSWGPFSHGRSGRRGKTTHSDCTPATQQHLVSPNSHNITSHTHFQLRSCNKQRRAEHSKSNSRINTLTGDVRTTRVGTKWFRQCSVLCGCVVVDHVSSRAMTNAGREEQRRKRTMTCI